MPTATQRSAVVPPLPWKDEAAAREELHHYLFDFDPRLDGVPKRVDPGVVAAFVHETLAAGRPAPDVAQRLVVLADYHDTRRNAADFALWLDRKEIAQETFLTSLALTRGVALLGDAAQRAGARAYYAHLLGHSMVEERPNDLFPALEALLPEEGTAPTTARLQAIARALAAREPTDPAAGTRSREVEDLTGVTLPRLAAADAAWQAILAIADLAPRLDALVDLYLGLNLAYHEYLPRRAVRALLREGRAGRAGDVAEAFRRALARAGSPDDEAARPRRAMALRAISFFGGALTDEEQAATAPGAGKLELLSP